MGKTRAPRSSTRAGTKTRVTLDDLAKDAIAEESVNAESISFRNVEPVHPHPTTTFEIGNHPTEEDVPTLAREINIFGPSDLDRAVFCRQLATLIEVGIPLLRALQMLAKRTSHGRLAKSIADVARRVEEGQSVSQAMDANVRAFSPLVCNIIRVGEAGGILETSLVRLAQIMEARADMKRKIGSALMYPAVALTIAVIVIGLILVKAVPVFMSVYGEAGVQLPGPTRLVINASHFVSTWYPLLLILFIAAIILLYRFAKTPRGRHINSVLALRTPTIGRINQKIAVARFSRTLSGLLSAGVPLVESIAIAADTNENTLVADALRKVHESVERGEKITRPLAQERIMPPLVIDMISIGEETGTLDTMLQKIADIYDAEVDAILRGLATIIEPVLIVILGGIVIFIALSVMLPYFQLVQIVRSPATMAGERYPRDKDELLREVDVRMKLGDIRRLHHLRQRLAPTWWEPVLVVILFGSALGLLASLVQYTKLRANPLDKWMVFWFALMILTNVLCFQVILFRMYNFRRLSDHLLHWMEDLQKRQGALDAKLGDHPDPKSEAPKSSE